MSVLLNCILLTILIVFCKASFNANPTTSVLGLQNVTGTTIQISEDDGMIAVGFADGTLKLFDTQVNQICSSMSTMGQQISQIVWMPSFGPVSVDVAFKVTLWSTDCNSSSQMSFNQSISRIAYTESTDQTSGNTTGIIGLNFEDRIQEYNIENFTVGNLYNPAVNDTFVDLVYYSDGTDTFLIASTTGAKVQVFNTSDNGSQIISFDVRSAIQRMDVIGGKIIGYGSNDNIYRFSTTGDIYSLGWFTPATSISVCPSTLEFALSQLSSPGIGDYLYAGRKEKSLAGINGIVQQVDCSKSYLVSIDEKGFINVYTYEIFKKWIIGMIVGIAVGLLVLIAGVIVCMRLRKKWAEEADQEKYRTNKPKKYPRNNMSPPKTQYMKMLHNMTLQTLSK